MKSELYLIDSSVWMDVIEVGRGAADLRDRVRELVRLDRVATAGIVRLEVLHGANSQAQWNEIEDTFSALHQLQTVEGLWDEAARLAIKLRREGVTVPSTDLLIASVAMTNEAVLLHRNHHFDLMAAHVPLRVESYV